MQVLLDETIYLIQHPTSHSRLLVWSLHPLYGDLKPFFPPVFMWVLLAFVLSLLIFPIHVFVLCHCFELFLQTFYAICI